MLDFGLFFGGIGIGIVVAAPIGPVNLICIRHTLRYGPLNGFVSGIGAAVGDGVFATIAAFGVTAAIDFIMANTIWLQSVGGLFLLGFGFYTFRAQPQLTAQLPRHAFSDMPHVTGTTFLLTITNPATMLGFAAIFGGIAGLGGVKEDYTEALLLVAGVVSGSLLWWASVSGFASLFRQKMSDRALEIVNQVTGALIAGFGIVVIGRVVWGLVA